MVGEAGTVARLPHTVPTTSKPPTLRFLQSLLDADYAQRSSLIERELMSLKAQRRKLDAGGADAAAVLRSVAASTSVAGRVGGPLGSGVAEGAKNPVQELKELCDRRRWAQPHYDFRLQAAGFACTLSLPEAGIVALVSPPASSQRGAKAAAALRALAHLRAAGEA